MCFWELFTEIKERKNYEHSRHPSNGKTYEHRRHTKQQKNSEHANFAKRKRRTVKPTSQRREVRKDRAERRWSRYRICVTRDSSTNYGSFLAGWEALLLLLENVSCVRRAVRQTLVVYPEQWRITWKLLTFFRTLTTKWCFVFGNFHLWRVKNEVRLSV